MKQAVPPCIVIGSGPSGVAAASALLDRGLDVLMLDRGADLGDAARGRADAMAQKAPRDWTAQDRRWLSASLDGGADIPLKTLFGEHFMYAMEHSLPAGFGQWPGQGLGGFSRVWGATLKRLAATDLAGWPLGEADLAAHYEAVEALMGPVGPPLSAQAASLLQRWQGQAAQMKKEDVVLTASSLAVSPDCRQCAMCLHGCPYGYIFSSDRLVRRWHDRPGFRYRPGVMVSAIAEHGAGVTLTVMQGGTRETVEASRVFVAAGVLETARLMMVSFGTPGLSLRLQDGQYFLLPLLSASAATDAQFHTLSQLFLTLGGTHPVHVQLYGQNDVYAAQIAARMGPLRALLGGLATRAGRHFLMAQGYLPSSLSGSAALSLQGTALKIAPQHAAHTGPALRQAWRRIARVGRLAGLHAVLPLAQAAEIGRGYHSGGTMPMAATPHRWQSDRIGRVNGLARVHVVDASTWPDIPSGPVTLTAMANAHRVASCVEPLS